MQTVALYNRTLEAIKGAGVKLVPFDAGPMVAYHDKYIGDSTFYTYEMGREVARRAPACFWLDASSHGVSGCAAFACRGVC